MSKYKAYTEYKSSEVDWLGDIPNEWLTIPVGRLFSRIKRTGHSDKELLSVYRDYGVIPKSSRDDNNNKASDDLTPYQLVQPNDLVMNKMKAWQGSIAVSEYEGIVSPAYFVYEPREKLFELAHPRYVHYLLRNPIYITQYMSRSKGIRVSQWDLDPEEFKTIELLLPSKQEQSEIFEFLDHETAKIDTLIDKQQQLIKLLKEKRQAVISHAVTKGLNLDAPMKDTEVEWFGSIPSHWKVMELKFSADDGYKTFTDGDWIESPYITDSGVRLLQTGNVGTGFFKEKGFRYISESSFSKLNCTEVKPNDVLICRLDGPVGRSCLAPNLGVKVITSVDNAILKPSNNFDPRFIVYLTNSEPWLRWVQDLCRVGGGFRLRISRTMLGEQRIPVPPFIEQVAIADMLDKLSEKHLICIDRAEQSIRLLHERRVALISEVVTGKIDVRNWQALEKEVTQQEAS